MKLILCAVDEALAKAWQQFCGDLDFVEIHRGNILDVPCDAVVSPANSFGFMDGGLYLIYLRHFGFGLQDRVRLGQFHGAIAKGRNMVISFASVALRRR